MTVAEAISRTDELKPNGFSYAVKLYWLSTLDGAVAEIINAHEGEEHIDFSGYTESSPNAGLLIPAPYDEAYLRYLEAQIDYANGDYERYNNANAMFAAIYSAYSNHYNRSYMPLGERKKYF